MATGVSGTLEFRSRDYSPGVGGSRFRFSYSETYDIAGNYSDVTFSNFQVAGIGMYNRVVLSGIIKANGTDIVNLADTDIGLVASGDNNFVNMTQASVGFPKTIRVNHGTDGKKTIAVAISPKNYTYFNLWFSGPASGNGFDSASQNIVLTNIPRGLVKIHNGTSFENYSIQIYNGSSWDRYTPYIYNGSSWEAYNGG